MGGSGGPDESRPESGLTSIGFTPLNEVLAGAAAVVHHGGIGTTAAALECGVPQVAIPRIFMQPTNAEWMRRLGVCTILHPREWTAENASKCVRAVVESSEAKRRAEEFAGRIDRQGALEAVCRFIENGV